jgi:hypothetical protein
MMEHELPIVRHTPCSACLRDPAFGSLHNGCQNCKVEFGLKGHRQEPLVRTVENGVVVYVPKIARIGG